MVVNYTETEVICLEALLPYVSIISNFLTKGPLANQVRLIMTFLCCWISAIVDLFALCLFLPDLCFIRDNDYNFQSSLPPPPPKKRW